MFAKLPDADGNREPYDGRTREYRVSRVIGYEPPNQKCKCHKADAASGRASRIKAGSRSRALGAIESSSFLLLLHMFFDQSSTRGKDCGEGEKQPANAGSEFLGDNACSCSDQPAEQKANCIFVPLRLPEP